MLARLKRLSLATMVAVAPIPGVALCATLAMAATAMAMMGGSAVVWALLAGLAIATIWPPAEMFLPGVALCAKRLLQIGVALLGFQVSAATLHVLDLATIVVLAANVGLILLAGWLLGPAMGLARDVSMIAAASVAICGASAAAAFAIVLLRGDAGKRDVACTIGAVSIVSSLAMLVYPPFLGWLGLDAAAGGILLGGTIHEVAHAVAAGYSIDAATGDVATMAKMLRVAMLAPACLIVALLPLPGAPAARTAVPLPPLFLLVFIGCALLTIAGLISPASREIAGVLSRFCLVVSMAAIGLTLPWRSIRAFGWRPVALLLALSAILLLSVGGYVVVARL